MASRQVEHYRNQIITAIDYIEAGIKVDFYIEVLKYFTDKYIEECKELHKNEVDLH